MSPERTLHKVEDHMQIVPGLFVASPQLRHQPQNSGEFLLRKKMCYLVLFVFLRRRRGSRAAFPGSGAGRNGAVCRSTSPRSGPGLTTPCRERTIHPDFRKMRCELCWWNFEQHQRTRGDIDWQGGENFRARKSLTGSRNNSLARHHMATGRLEGCTHTPGAPTASRCCWMGTVNPSLHWKRSLAATLASR